MDFRVTPRVGIDLATSELAKQAAELQRTQQQISTGIRLHRPSDDPAATRRSIVQKDKLSRLQTHVESVNHVKARVSQAHVQLREAQQLFVSVRGIAQSAAQATEPAELNALASELEGTLDQFISLANASDESGYLFAGTATQTKPFAVERSTGIDSVQYTGTPANSQLHVTGDIPREALTSGDHVFQSVVREPTIIIGDTGLSPGVGTDTAKAELTVTVSHTATSFAGASGVSIGDSSVGGDTLVGIHELTITDTSGTGASGTITLNGGGPIAFTNADTDLQVRGPTGELIHLNTTAITAGFNGTVAVTADGTLSVDGGATTQPITFTDSETITIPANGTVVHFDTTTLKKTGEDSVEFPGTTDAFQVMMALRDDLRNTRDLTGDQLHAAFSRRLGDIERIENHLLDEIGVQGVALQQMERLEIRTEDQELEQKIKYGETVNADLAEAAVRMQELLNLQQFTMASISKVFSQNLLQFIQ